MSCSYCCNEIPEVRSRFVEKKFNEIDFNKYENICITGGEPFLDKRFLYVIINSISEFKKVYIYTNGLLIDWDDIYLLTKFDNIKGINIGLHTIQQLKRIKPVERFLPVRFMMNEDMKQSFLKVYKHRLNDKNIKTWKMNECDLPNEDWILLKGE
jgi:molybdenum cofactor biosynthesis enzyme MoaA